MVIKASDDYISFCPCSALSRLNMKYANVSFVQIIASLISVVTDTLLSSQNPEMAYVLYNDQRPPQGSGDRRGHSSGTIGGHTKGEQHINLTLRVL